jgi:hypothetical protein
MNSSKKYEENLEQEFFWNDVPPRKEQKINQKLTRETALNYCNNLIFAVSHDQKLLEQVKQLKQYIREK